MSRKDDPVFNVKFVQAVERNQCLWNSTLPAYSKKEEIQRAWQDVANETKDTVRSCRERWRTIRSSFLRSLKMSRTNTGRGKRKYYLSKYLQFLIPFTKTRPKHHTPTSMMALRKYSSISHLSGLPEAPQTPSQTPLPTPPPMTCINHMPLPIVSSDDTKDSTSSDVAAIAEEDVVVSLMDTDAQQHPHHTLYHNNTNSSYNTNNSNHLNNSNNATHSTNNSNSNNNNNMRSSGFYNQQFQHATSNLQQQLQHQMIQHHQPLRLPSIKNEPSGSSNTPPPLNYSQNNADKKSSSNNTNNNNNHATPVVASSNTRTTISSSTATATVDLSEFADWIKNKNGLPQQQRNYATALATQPDADQSFLNSLHPYLKEMSGKQNRRFRQKVVALIDAILDNTD